MTTQPPELATTMARIRFVIHYRTRWGENLLLEPAPEPVAAITTRPPSLALHAHDDGWWSGTLDLDAAVRSFAYRYRCEGPDGAVRREPVDRRIEINTPALTVIDQWLAPELPDATFVRQAFAGIIFQPEATPVPVHDLADPARGFRLTLRAARVPAGCRIGISGGHPALGSWDPARALPLSGAAYPRWQVDLPRAVAEARCEFKFGTYRDSTGRLKEFEDGPNRVLPALPSGDEAVVVNLEQYRHRSLWKGAGVAIPVFALRSERGFGIGEFADLASFAVWAADAGLHLVQLLPVNDTTSHLTWRDSYPYKAISTAALHPIYVNLDDLFAEYDVPLPTGHAAERDALNQRVEIDYERVWQGKTAALRGLFAAVKTRALASREFKAFWRENADWLKPYAAFCRLRDQHGSADFSQWGQYATWSEKRVQAWFKSAAPEHDHVMFHVFVQHHLKRQFNRALAAGHARGVAFKGDLPIGIDRESVEVWTQPEWFHLDRQTGAPPDTFSALGQNWGFPTYDWPRMDADGYSWWHRRFQRMSGCFDALRIDHILGFFRIWEIPGDQTEGILGHFNPALPLDRDELRAARIPGDPSDYAVPAVAEKDLATFFGADAADVAARFLVRDGEGWFRFKSEFARELDWRSALNDWPDETERIRVADGLKRLDFEVLLVPDPDRTGRFHPRIGLRETRRFQALTPAERTAFAEFHDDFFYRRHTQFWAQEALKKLPALMDASPMLICGEDLGMIPDSVPVVLNQLGLLSLEVQSMPKRLGQRFGKPDAYPYLSVCTTSTHDTPTLRGFWAEDAEARRAFYRDQLHRAGEPPAELTPELCERIVAQNLAGASMWCVLPLQDWLGIDGELRRPDAATERINVPANPRHYWRFRLHLTIEQLRAATDFTRHIRQMVTAAGRQTAG